MQQRGESAGAFDKRTHCGPAQPDDQTSPFSSRITPESTSCTYSRRGSCSTSLATLGRLAARSAFHCATDVRYSSLPSRVAALRGDCGIDPLCRDAYDNALAESTIGLFKTEAVSKRSPFLNGPLKTIDDVEFATMGWVDWFNQRRLPQHPRLPHTRRIREGLPQSRIGSPPGDVASVGAARNPGRFTDTARRLVALLHPPGRYRTGCWGTPQGAKRVGQP